MMFPERSDEVLLRNVSVPLRGGNRGVTQKFLDHPDIGAMSE